MIWLLMYITCIHNIYIHGNHINFRPIHFSSYGNLFNIYIYIHIIYIYINIYDLCLLCHLSTYFDISKLSLAAGTFATQLKWANIVLIHKKYEKQLVSSYQPVSLLSICSKIFEKVIFNTLFKFFWG